MSEHADGAGHDALVAPIGSSALTASALTAALRGAGTIPLDAEVTDLTLLPVGTGQMADTFRVAAHYRPHAAGLATVIAKLPAADEESAGAARATGSYERECPFYTDVAPTLAVPLPRFLGIVEIDDEPQGLLLEDLAQATHGDQVAGADATSSTWPVVRWSDSKSRTGTTGSSDDRGG